MFLQTGGHLQLQLHKVIIQIFSDEECGRDKNYDSDIHICAGIKEGGKGQCTVSLYILPRKNEKSVPISATD